MLPKASEVCAFECRHVSMGDGGRSLVALLGMKHEPLGRTAPSQTEPKHQIGVLLKSLRSATLNNAV